MKPRLYERLLTALFALAVCAFAAVLVAGVWNRNARLLAEALLPFDKSGLPLILCIGAYAVCALWAVYVVFIHVKMDRSRHSGFVSVQNSESGEVLISVPALHSLASRAVANIDGVSCKDVRVIEHADSISLKLRMTIQSDHNIPSATAEMQRAIRTHIEMHSGIAVRDVKVIVTDIVAAPDLFVAAAAPMKEEKPVEEIYYAPEPAVREEEGSARPDESDDFQAMADDFDAVAKEASASESEGESQDGGAADAQAELKQAEAAEGAKEDGNAG